MFLWGATEGIVFPPLLLTGPSQKPPGVPGFLRKNILAPITPEPSAGLFTLAWLPDSFTDVTYRHTGTLSQRGRGSTGSEEVERTRRRRRSGIDEEWRGKEDGGWVTRIEEKNGHGHAVKRRDKRSEGGGRGVRELEC